jgi:hypothetical protein
VRAGLVQAAGDWRWSSYRATAGDVLAPAWLDTTAALSQFAASPASARERYRAFVREGHAAPSPWDNVRGQVYLGSDAFVGGALTEAGRVRHPEVPRPQRERAASNVDDVLQPILGALGTTRDDLVLHPRLRARERALVAYALRRYAAATGTIIGRVLRVSSWQAAAQARAGERACRLDGNTARLVEQAVGADQIHQT